jgi:positive regulator of sigma E activity
MPARPACSGLGTGPRRYRLENRIGAGVGDQVQLTVADGTVWRASLLSYVLPLLLAIGGAAIGQFAAGDAGAVIGNIGRHRLRPGAAAAQ